ncbi:MAG: hypothetical protein ABJA85_05645 [Bacteroidota bacterium]
MKKIKLFASAVLVSFIALISCQREGKELLKSEAITAISASNCNYTCSDYQVNLTVDKTTEPGHTIFIWSITNPCPGNGKNGSLQDLSHWDFLPGQCLDDNWQDVLQASYKYGNGSWNIINPLPVIEPDPSLRKGGCYGDDVFKFNQGTSGSTTTYYKLVLNGNWGTGNLDLYFKSGVNTGCCSKSIANKGVGCPEEEGCSFSQGYWFANNPAHPDGVHPWGGDGSATVTVGGKVYTNPQGLAIWNTSNAGGIKDSKKAFTQLAAIRLSGVDETDPALSGAIATIECWLGSIPKLSPANLPNQSATSITTCGNAKNAAGIISDWINAHHCVTPEN